jgi:2-octaprenyl-6-methoxyphenol hydroxylase
LTRAVAGADVLIAGGGFAGLALALALRQALGPRFAVTLVDPALAHGEDPRASAIAAAPRRMFEALGVWTAVAAEAQPILDMVITDSRVDDAVRPVFLTFEGEIEPGEPFAHMIENARLVAELAARPRRGRDSCPAGEGFPPPRRRVGRLGDGSTSRQALSLPMAAGHDCASARASRSTAGPMASRPS